MPNMIVEPENEDGMLKTVGNTLKALRRAIFGEPAPKVAVVRLYGVIAPGQRFRQSLNMAGVAGQLEHAFGMGGIKAVALLINSPGGSPVQASMITDRVRALAREKDVPVLAFAEDLAASGGYMLALAGDEIYANESSIIGSIGVVSSGFGFKKAIEKIGVERRLYTAGESKAMLDAFQDEKPEDVERLKAIQGEIHEHFKSMVRDRRGKRLKGLRGKIFSGEVFTGQDAVKLGLIDGIGDVRMVMRNRFGRKVKLKVVGESKPRLRSLIGLGRNAHDGLGSMADIPGAAIAAVEERLFWNKFGL
ncbi:S49 family peptidase [Kordiimonas marina]|uniref:S49 family peptidase n=1 Tax=Kordiimonas marina TaxID=2872312 RepID=UPI001FF56A67|nr:S49 family peptidase [Kordiimonas marina]